MPLLVFVLALLATGGFAWYLWRSLESSDAIRFEHEVSRIAQSMQERLDLSVTLLRGTAGLFEAEGDVSGPQFSAYVQRLRLRELYPGVQGIGYARVLRPAQADAYIAQRRRHDPGFRIWPEGDRPLLTTIAYLEPQDERNRVAIGYDMATEPVRAAAMRAAADSGQAQASGKVTLVQEIDERKQAGFLIYLPLFAGGGVPAPAERAARLTGYVYSAFRADDLLAGVRGGDLSIDYAVYAQLDAAPASLLRSTVKSTERDRSPPRFKAERRLQVAGQTWRVLFTNRPDFEGLSPRRLAPLAFAAALVTSLLLAGLSWVQARRRHAALALAEAGLRNTRLYEELAEQARRKDEFLAMLGHELRNPLAPIVTAVDALQRGVPPDRAARLYGIIGRQARQLTHLVNDLLEASRISTGRIAIRRETMQIEAAVHNAVEAIQPLLQQRGQQLQIERRGTPAPLQGDATRLAQVLVNLLHNASKFSPGRATLTLTVDEQPEGVRLTVRDPGEGMDPQAVERMFELFAQERRHPAEASQHDRHGGLGIGLALVRRLVELHGGWVRAESAGPGQGSAFTVWLPRG
jgi:signal transduction histidine kinase